MRAVLNFAAISTLSASTVYAQTPEADLESCMIREVAQYQPVSEYSKEFKCSVGNKKPFGGTPSDRVSGDVRYSGHIILTAEARETFKISDGGHTAPFIFPDKSAVTIVFWCQAENKDYGKSGKYNVRVSGQKQRIATDLERRRALTKCSKQIRFEGIL